MYGSVIDGDSCLRVKIRNDSCRVVIMPIIIIAATLICIVLLPVVIPALFPLIAVLFGWVFSDTNWYFWLVLIIMVVVYHIYDDMTGGEECRKKKKEEREAEKAESERKRRLSEKATTEWLVQHEGKKKPFSKIER